MRSEKARRGEDEKKKIINRTFLFSSFERFSFLQKSSFFLFQLELNSDISFPLLLP